MTVFEVAGTNIAAEEFEDEYVVLDLGSGYYFSIAGITAIVWRGLVDGHTVAALSEGLDADDVRHSLILESQAAFVSHGLLREAAKPSTPNLSASDLAASIGAAEPELRFEMFKDMAELLLADPIHDADEEAGWPHLPTDPKI